MLHIKADDMRPVAGRADRSLRVALIGGFGTGNFGNDASLDTALALFQARMPDADLVSICYDPELVRSRFGLPTIKLSHRPRGLANLLDHLLLRIPSAATNWVRAIWSIGRADVMVFPGTGIFDDYRTGPLGFPAQVFRWCVAARLRGVRVIFLSVGAGPIVNPLSRFFLKTAAQVAAHRSYRDGGSKAFMQSIGVDESKSPVLPDIVFAMPVDQDAPPAAPKGQLTVAIGVMSYRGWRIDEAVGADYLDKLARLVRHLEGKGHRVRFLIAEPSDARALAELERKLGDGVDRGGSARMETLRDVMEQIRGADVVVGSRFHVLIAALKLGRPAISLSYGPKHDLLLAEAGIGEFCQPADFFDLDLLIRHLEEVAADLPRYSATVRERVATMVRQWTEAEPRLFSEIAGE